MKKLRFTTTKPMSMLGILNPIEDHKPLTLPNDVGEFIMDTIKGKNAYIHGEAEEIAGFDIPTFIDGNLGQLDLPITEQEIYMVLPNGVYQCKATYNDTIGASNCYLITLMSEPDI